MSKLKSTYSFYLDLPFTRKLQFVTNIDQQLINFSYRKQALISTGCLICRKDPFKKKMRYNSHNLTFMPLKCIIQGVGCSSVVEGLSGAHKVLDLIPDHKNCVVLTRHYLISDFHNSEKNPCICSQPFLILFSSQSLEMTLSL
jgi:hypothetical protein